MKNPSAKRRDFLCIFMVGAAGFEPTASYSRSKRSTKLSHAPTFGKQLLNYSPQGTGLSRNFSPELQCGYYPRQRLGPGLLMLPVPGWCGAVRFPPR